MNAQDTRPTDDTQRLVEKISRLPEGGQRAVEAAINAALGDGSTAEGEVR